MLAASLLVRNGPSFDGKLYGGAHAILHYNNNVRIWPNHFVWLIRELDCFLYTHHGYGRPVNRLLATDVMRQFSRKWIWGEGEYFRLRECLWRRSRRVDAVIIHDANKHTHAHAITTERVRLPRVLRTPIGWWWEDVERNYEWQGKEGHRRDRARWILRPESGDRGREENRFSRAFPSRTAFVAIPLSPWGPRETVCQAGLWVINLTVREPSFFLPLMP